MSLSRRTFLATASACLALPAIARAQTTHQLKLSHYLPPQHQINTELNRWADELRETTGGGLDIQVFPAGQMGPPPRQYDLARTGVADLAFVYIALSPGRFPRTDALSLPFLFADEAGVPVSTADASWIATSMKDLLQPEYQGTEVLYDVVSTSLGFFMKDKLIETPDDMKGLRIRPTSAIVANQLEALGASPATIAPTELADAIAKGVVDGAVFNFEGGKAFQLQQAVTKVSQLASSVGFFSLVMNKAALDRLPADMRAVIHDSTGPEAGRRVGALYDKAEAAGRQFMVEKGVEVIELTGDRKTPFAEKLKPVADRQIADLEAKGIDVDAIVARVDQLKAEL